jgi:uncharacterized membrane-anchored protein YhcB (DUF1043 family)
MMIWCCCIACYIIGIICGVVILGPLVKKKSNSRLATLSEEWADYYEEKQRNHDVEVAALRTELTQAINSANHKQAALEVAQAVIQKNAVVIKEHFADMRSKCQALLSMMTVTIDGKECTDGGNGDEAETEGS